MNQISRIYGIPLYPWSEFRVPQDSGVAPGLLRCSPTELSRGSTIELSRGSPTELSRGSTIELSRGSTIELSRG